MFAYIKYIYYLCTIIITNKKYKIMKAQEMKIKEIERIDETIIVWKKYINQYDNKYNSNIYLYSSEDLSKCALLIKKIKDYEIMKTKKSLSIA